MTAYQKTQGEGDVVEAADTNGFVITFRPEEWEGREDKVQDAEEISHIERENLDNRLRTEELERSDECALHVVGDFASTVLELGVQSGVASFFAELLGLDA